MTQNTPEQPQPEPGAAANADANATASPSGQILPSAPPTDDPAAGHAPAEAQLIRMELILGSILVFGVWGSLAVILLGIVLCFANADHYRGGEGALAALTTPESAHINTIAEVFSGLVRFDGPSIVMLGVVILISTPAVRVAVSMIVYMRQRDRTYVLLTGAVLLLLLFGYFKKQDKPLPTSAQPTAEAVDREASQSVQETHIAP